VRESHLHVLRTRWRLILLVMIAALIGASMVTALIPPTYTSKITMYVSATSSGEDAAEAFQASLLAQERTRQYDQLVTSTRVSQQVILRLGLTTDPAELASRITASSALESVMMDVSVTAQSAVEATAVANAIGEIFPDLVADVERRPADASPLSIGVVDGATQPSTQTLNLLLFNLALGALGGFVLGVGGAFVVTAIARRGARDQCAEEPPAEDRSREPDPRAMNVRPRVPVNSVPHAPRTHSPRR
jgi:succinoglycan biosynthesis transport protein ExoP